MEHLKIWEKINRTKTVEDLKNVIKETWGEEGIIMGRSEPFGVVEMLRYIDDFADRFDGFIKGQHNFVCLPTREYGIRQQLCFILLNPTRLKRCRDKTNG